MLRFTPDSLTFRGHHSFQQVLDLVLSTVPLEHREFAKTHPNVLGFARGIERHFLSDDHSWGGRAGIITPSLSRAMVVPLPASDVEKASKKAAEDAAIARQAEIQRQQAAAEAARQAEIQRQQAVAEAARQAEIQRQQAAAEAARQAEIQRQQAVAEIARQAEIQRQQALVEAARQAEIQRQQAEAEVARQAAEQRMAEEALLQAEIETASETQNQDIFAGIESAASGDLSVRVSRMSLFARPVDEIVASVAANRAAP